VAKAKTAKKTAKTTAKKTARKPAASKVPARKSTLKGTGVSDALVNSFEADFASNPQYKVLQNAITQINIRDMAWEHSVVKDDEHVFSIQLDKWTATNQGGSGRCWMFAAMNLFRVGAMEKLNVANFEFSQTYPLFWDKIEKANYFLEAMIDTADRDIDDRTVKTLLSRPVDDGGQWNMFIDLVNKYGLVPKSVMPETESSMNTGSMNGVLIEKLRYGAKKLRDMAAAGVKPAELRAAKEEILNVVFRVLTIHLGEPPRTFDWQWKDKAGKTRRERNMTPQKFAAKYITVPLDDYVCLVHDPRNPIGKTYTVEYLGNIVGGNMVTYLNIDVELMKQITFKSLQDGEPVWFGCDVGKDIHTGKGLWDLSIKNLDALYNTVFDVDKASRLEYCMTAMTHAMLFTGVDVVGGKPRAWRVENSWGADKAKAGFYRMNDSWFNEHMFEIAARSKYLPAKLKAALVKKPTTLPAWDPMGSLARIQ
jgi:bleomycin hydrolase